MAEMARGKVSRFMHAACRVWPQLGDMGPIKVQPYSPFLLFLTSMLDARSIPADDDEQCADVSTAWCACCTMNRSSEKKMKLVRKRG